MTNYSLYVMANLTSNESSKKAFIDYCNQFSIVSINSNKYRPAFDYIKDTIQKNPDYKNDPEIFGSLVKAVSGYKFLDLASSKIKNTKQSMLKFIDETDRVFDAIEIVGRAETGLKRDAGFLFSAYDKVLQLAIKQKRPAWACEVFDKADTSLKQNENFIFNAFDKLAESVQLENVSINFLRTTLNQEKPFLDSCLENFKI